MFQSLLSQYRRHRIIIRVMIGFFVFYVLTGFFVAPLIIQSVLENKVSQTLNRQIRMAGASVNPFTFCLRIKDLSISEPDGNPFVQIQSLSVNTDPMTSLLKWMPVVRSIEISAPRVRIIRTGADRFNFSDLAAGSRTTAPTDSARDSKPLRFILGMFKIASGEIRFVDNSLGTPFESVLTALEVSIDGLDTRSEAEAFRYHLDGRTQADERLQVDGSAHIQPFSAEFDVALHNLRPANYAPYYQPYLKAQIAGGRVDLDTKLRWSAQSRTLSDLVFAVSGFVLRDHPGAETLLEIPDMAVKGADIDLEDRSIRLGRVSSKDARVYIQRNDRGIINLQTALVPPAGPKDTRQESGRVSHPADQSSAWQIHVPQLNLDNYTVDFEDLQPEKPVHISLHHIGLAAENLSTQGEAQGKVAVQLQWADEGTLSAKGDIRLIPLQAGLEVAVEKVDIRPLQPYIEQFAQLVVTKGEFGIRGRVDLQPVDRVNRVNFTGQASINGFEAVDAEKAALFSKWKSLFLSEIDIGTAPLKIKVGEAALTDFYKRLIVNADGTVNLETIISRRPPEAAVHQQAESAFEKGRPVEAQAVPSDTRKPDIQIKTVTLQGGKIDFSDYYIKPNVQFVLLDLGGRISGLDNIKENRADVLLRGNVGGNLPMEIKGRVNPLIEKPFIDLNLEFPSIDLSPFAPYAGKYLGYSLDKGQLAFVVSYKVVDNKLAGQNKIQINQLTFGDPVASSQATKLPVKLAVALLKDRQGNIDLDLPVKGNLDDPEFSMGGIILKMLTNLIVEIVSSPFKMLGAIFGGGEELAYLEFDPGRSSIPAERTQKLDTLAKILFERPGLNLEIQGQVVPEKDADGLRQIRFAENLKAGKLKALVAAGRKAVPLDQLEITAQERDNMIREAFTRATFPKPRDEKGRLKALGLPEMEKLLYTAIEISTDDLRRLAYQRAAAAKDYLLTSGRIEAGRLYIIEPEPQNTKPPQTMEPRVRFNLK